MKKLIISAALAAGVVMCPGIGTENAEAQNRNRSDRFEYRARDGRVGTYHYRGGRRDRWERRHRRDRWDDWDRGDYRRWRRQQRRWRRGYYRPGYRYGYRGYGYFNRPWGEGIYTPGFGIYWR